MSLQWVDDAIELIEGSEVIKSEVIYATMSEKFNVSVFQAIYKMGVVAVKSYTLKQENIDYGEVWKEIRILQSLSKLASPQNCFLRYYGTYVEPGKINMVMEYLPQTFSDKMIHLRNLNYRFTNEMLSTVMARLLRSYAHMMELGIFHCNIKPQNLLIDEFWNIKIIDFSISLVKEDDLVSEGMSFNIVQGTEGWSAPEIQKYFGKQDRAMYNPESADIFSLGLVILQLISFQNLKTYFNSESTTGLINLVNQLYVCEEIKDILRKMLSLDPHNRSTLRELAAEIEFNSTVTG